MNREQRRAAGQRGAGGDPLACHRCGTGGQFTSPDDPPRIGSTLVCGVCGELLALDARQVWDTAEQRTEWAPFVRLPVLEELEARRAEPAVAELLRAFELAQVERRMRGAARKGPKIGKGLVLADGDQLKLEGHGPDYRGAR